MVKPLYTYNNLDGPGADEGLLFDLVDLLSPSTGAGLLDLDLVTLEVRQGLGTLLLDCSDLEARPDGLMSWVS